MKSFKHILALLTALTLLLSFAACEARDLKAFGDSLDALGFSEMHTAEEFFALADNFSRDGKTASELMEYQMDNGKYVIHTNANDTLTMKQETRIEEDGKFATTFQQFATYIALDGLTLPRGVTVGMSLEDALEALVGNTKALTKFKPTDGYKFEMLLAGKNGASIVFRDMTQDETVSSYAYRYQIRYTDEVRYMTESGSVGVKRTCVLSFDNTAEGHPLTMIEIVLESRHRA